MPRDRQTIGICPQCRGGALVCTYNYFSGPAERIDSWEHRCADCGFRETQAYRAAEGVESAAIDPEICPFCQRQGTL